MTQNCKMSGCVNRKLREALAATDDLSGLILCDA